MLFAPKLIGNLTLNPEDLREDRKHCRRIGPCGLGEKAMYLNDFFVDRRFYVTYTDVRRAYKRLAMSKGGFSGKGIFASMPYLVVELSNGQSRQCNFKYEEDVDKILAALESTHPEIPTHSKHAQELLRKAKEAEEASYVQNLSESAQETIRELEGERAYLEARPELSLALTAAARGKRAFDNRKPLIVAAAAFIAIIALLAILLGVYEIAQGAGMLGIYPIMFGLAFLFTVLSTQVLPIGRNGRKHVEASWDAAVNAASDYIQAWDEADEEFPVRASYAHPVVLSRMIRVIRQGRAQTKEEALNVVKNDLKALNNTVTVSQAEYDEVVAVKPMFLVMDYQ